MAPIADKAIVDVVAVLGVTTFCEAVSAASILTDAGIWTGTRQRE